jgi:hypothetical protein
VCSLSCSDQGGASTSSANATGTPMVIAANLSVGSVRAGMNLKEVVAALGEPQRRTANALEYTGQGFAVVPDRSGIVQFVMCGDVMGIKGPLVKAFTGRTKEGIGMNSTRDELVAALGQAAAVERLPGGQESLRYDALGLKFTLQSGKVHHIVVRLQGPLPPDRTVSLEPPPGK